MSQTHATTNRNVEPVKIIPNVLLRQTTIAQVLVP